MRPKRIIDMHHHLPAGDMRAHARELARQAEALNIEKVVILGLEWRNLRCLARNDAVLEAARECPELIVPFAGIDPEWPADAARVDALREAGFVGLKFIHPQLPYHDERLFPWYARAEALRMPVLFHLGIVARIPGEDPDRVDCSFMHPVYLDTIARSFPDLQVIGAHFGNPWFEEAAMCCRWNPNLYLDVSGSSMKRESPAALGELYWWGGSTYPFYTDALGRNAWEKIVFGSDVKAADIGDVVNDTIRLVETLDFSPELADAIFYRTGAAILKHAGVPVAG